MNSSLKAERPGLCTTCNNASDCVYRSQRGFDATYCETYVCYSMTVVGSDETDDTESNITSAKSTSRKKTQHLDRGLCSNCENCDKCHLPKPDGGVWHCEEYC